ncbi:uncharacterized protein PITG_22765 [Phytophthora infestans T30-4]|uniref:Uncharacterized protein n=2 Tax=Phytophthora infestans TaxID=4787 RepID=D0N3C2_PHYIT|nr:uncharacterized protein PITG_22765 [Phytophthora infestans T30-4]EEY69414.1 conserved hypothetical protein [Phytophthora infestans T30-4]KAF4042258.1 hypothetical protein GN244_ATG05628 [Phytophthora infestans]KAF4138005.1 hypothetical protein GN958_ATG12958 [Phytophthora infestans]KAI9997047.1 hypothetical protein PInf_000480 [Phytophthora infestans]|eukprot:XP_002999268.1 conserved hypothetical protein [Phytophthora infestans T30-4]
MATSTAPIAIPSHVHPLASDLSPRGVDLEGRLDLSLDALIKERRKEHKLLKKQDDAKKSKQKPQPADKRKMAKQQKPQQQQSKKVSTVKIGQKAQRKALVNKNRGLPTLSATAKDKTTQSRTKTSIAATTAKLRRQMRAEKVNNSSSDRLVASKGTNKSNTAHLSKKKNAPQLTRKVSSPVRVVQPKNSKKLQAPTKQLKAQAKPLVHVRQVMRTNNKKAKLSITITGSKNSQKRQKAATKVLLPGKLSQALAKKTSAAAKVVKRAKNRKASAAKTVKVVRKVPGKGKKH